MLRAEFPRWKRHLLANPDLFLLRYFPHKLGLLEEFHLELIRIATQERRGICLFPAGHGKSTIVSTCLPIWAVCCDPNVRIGIVAKNKTESDGIMRSIQAELLANEELIEDFGPFYDEEKERPFSLTRLEVAKRTRRDKSATMAMFGAGSKDTLGYRTDWTICDDVVTQDNSNTPEQRFKLRQWFNQQLATMPQESDDRITVVGTLFDPSDLYNDLLEMMNPETGEHIWVGEKFDAIKDEEGKKPLWPAQWDWTRLMIEKASIGTQDFNKRYRNIAVDPSRMVFREEYIKGGWIGKSQYVGCLDRNHVIGPDTVDPTWRRVAGFDPAIGLGKKAKFCAEVTLAVGSCDRHERCYWILDLVRDQMSLPRQVDRILTHHQEYDLQSSIVEANSYQAGLFQALQQRMEEQGLEFKILPHFTSRTNKPDPELGVQAMAPAFENGWVHIPWGNHESQRKMNVLVDELIQYPGRTTDTVMALWFAWRYLKESAPRYKSFNRLKQHAGAMPWRQPQRRRVIHNPYYRDREAA